MKRDDFMINCLEEYLNDPAHAIEKADCLDVTWHGNHPLRIAISLKAVMRRKLTYPKFNLVQRGLMENLIDEYYFFGRRYEKEDCAAKYGIKREDLPDIWTDDFVTTYEEFITQAKQSAKSRANGFNGGKKKQENKESKKREKSEARRASASNEELPQQQQSIPSRPAERVAPVHPQPLPNPPAWRDYRPDKKDDFSDVPF